MLASQLGAWNNTKLKLDNFCWFKVLGTYVYVIARMDVSFKSGAIFLQSMFCIRNRILNTQNRNIIYLYRNHVINLFKYTQTRLTLIIVGTHVEI